MTEPLNSVLKQLPALRDSAEASRDVLLSNLVMIGEVASPTFHEHARVEMLLSRFSEYGLHNCSSDEKDNAFGVLPGTEGKRNILLATNLDTLSEADAPPSIEIREGSVIGPFVGDNSLALSAMMFLPYLMDRLGLTLKSNLILMGAARTLARGNLEGLRFFTANSTLPIHNGIWLESVQLGRLNYACLGMLRGDITVHLPEEYNWARFGATGSIIPMGDIISRISKIPIPHRPLTSLILGRVEGGLSYQNIARQAVMGFEARSESSEHLREIENKMIDNVEEVAAMSGVEAKVDVFAHRQPGALAISHPLVRSARAILDELKVAPMMYSTTSAMSALLDAKIPSVTIACTVAERRPHLAEIEEVAEVKPMFTGVAQLLGLILAMDEGLCDEPKQQEPSA